MTEKNPWLSITEGNVKIAECDVPYFERKGSVEEYAENINLKDDEAFLNATIQNLRLRSDSCFWAENIRNKTGCKRQETHYHYAREDQLDEAFEKDYS